MPIEELDDEPVGRLDEVARAALDSALVRAGRRLLRTAVERDRIEHLLHTIRRNGVGGVGPDLVTEIEPEFMFELEQIVVTFGESDADNGRNYCVVYYLGVEPQMHYFLRWQRGLEPIVLLGRAAGGRRARCW